MSEQMNCPNCDSEKIAMEKRPGGWFHCQDCHYSWQPYPVRFGFDAPPRKQTVFQQITASPEVLAEKLVYRQVSTVFIGEWRSVILPVHIYGCFRTKEEAIAATVEKLKEVCNE